MLRSILVPLDGSPTSELATGLALDWAKHFGAQVVGLGVVDEAAMLKPELVALGPSIYQKERDDALADARRHVHQFVDAFWRRSAKAGIHAAVAQRAGDPASWILREAQRCDLIMLGRDTHFHFETREGPDRLLGTILRESARPLVLVPPETSSGHGVMVAYGGGREVARALQMFQLLGLSRGEAVHLVSVQREGWEASELAKLAGDFLAAHGVAHEQHTLSSHQSPAETLLEQVRVLQPRLLVMGAHGHHPVRDLFVTSVTRGVLDKCPVPVFIAA